MISSSGTKPSGSPTSENWISSACSNDKKCALNLKESATVTLGVWSWSSTSTSTMTLFLASVTSNSRTRPGEPDSLSPAIMLTIPGMSSGIGAVNVSGRVLRMSSSPLGLSVSGVLSSAKTTSSGSSLGSLTKTNRGSVDSRTGSSSATGWMFAVGCTKLTLNIREAVELLNPLPIRSSSATTETVTGTTSAPTGLITRMPPARVTSRVTLGASVGADHQWERDRQ